MATRPPIDYRPAAVQSLDALPLFSQATGRDLNDAARHVVSPHFDGATYSPERDQERLSRQYDRVFAFMRDGHWATLAQIQRACGGTEAACSARLRDFRKVVNGAHTVERRRHPTQDGLHEYRLVITGGQR